MYASHKPEWSGSSLVERAVHIQNTFHSSGLLNRQWSMWKRAIFIGRWMNLNKDSYPTEIRLKKCKDIQYPFHRKYIVEELLSLGAWFGPMLYHIQMKKCVRSFK